MFGSENSMFVCEGLSMSLYLSSHNRCFVEGAPWNLQIAQQEVLASWNNPSRLTIHLHLLLTSPMAEQIQIYKNKQIEIIYLLKKIVVNVTTDYIGAWTTTSPTNNGMKDPWSKMATYCFWGEIDHLMAALLNFLQTFFQQMKKV